MSFFRPEARAAIWRWREVLIGAGLICLGLWWAFGVIGWLVNSAGYLVVLVGVALLMIGLQRGRFRADSDGPGVVQIVERRVAYFGPLTGGAVDLAGISRLSLDHRVHPGSWVLIQPGADPLHIPVTAKGAEALFDAFAALPGLRTEYMLRALSVENSGETLIWQREKTTPGLH